VAVGGKTLLVDLDEVQWFEAADKHLKIVTATQAFWARLSLKELQPHLDPDVFWGIHRSYIVAAKAIHSAERDEDGRMRLRLKGRNDLLPVSRAQQGRFKGY
jgi:DNA-binding LytR/AlgR family response regulator